MADPAARLLELLSLLQSRRSWPGSELAERLGVTGRTVRSDIARLRELGYPVHANRGSTGSYRLGAGAEQRHCLAPPHVGQAGPPVRVRGRQWRHWKKCLPGNREGFPAGGEDSQVRAAAE